MSKSRSSVAAACGDECRLDPSTHSIGATTANRFTWKVRKGAVLLCQWSRDGKKFHTKTFDSAKMRVADGAELLIQYGRVVRQFTYE